MVVLFVALLVFVVRKKGGRAAIFWQVFLLVFTGAWATVIWTKPGGPIVFGAAWMPLLFTGIIMAMLLVIAPPRDADKYLVNPGHVVPPEEDRRREEKASMAMGGFYLVLLLAMLVVIFYGGTL